jgi:hypothetical protein
MCGLNLLRHDAAMAFLFHVRYEGNDVDSVKNGTSHPVRGIGRDRRLQHNANGAASLVGAGRVSLGESCSGITRVS